MFNDSFLRYIQDVLRAGKVEAAQSTIEALVARTLRDLNQVDDPRHRPRRVATLKGDGRLAEVLARAVWARGHADRGPRAAARCAPVPGRDVRGRGGGRGSAEPGRAVRRRPVLPPGARPPDPGPDGARRRLPDDRVQAAVAVDP